MLARLRSLGLSGAGLGGSAEVVKSRELAQKLLQVGTHEGGRMSARDVWLALSLSVRARESEMPARVNNNLHGSSCK